jgi:acetyltransferase-like isoleucine patch superfamily enzyme
VKDLVKRLLTWGLPDRPAVRAIYRAGYRVGVLTYETVVWLKKVFIVEPTMRALCVSVGKRLRIERIPYMRNWGQIVIGNDVYISGKIDFGFNTALGLNPTLRIGDHTFIGHQCSFSIAKGITIGNHCLIAGGAGFFDNDGHPVDATKRRDGQRVSVSDVHPIVVGNDVWIGTGCRILKGVRIGDRAIIGAGSIVTKDVAPDTIVAGNPARITGTVPTSDP